MLALLQGHFHLPAHDEPFQDLHRGGLQLGAEQRLGIKLACGVADQHPANRHRRHAGVIPHTCSTDNVDRALADLDQAIKLDPGQGYFYTNRAKARLLKGDNRSALGDLDQAIELDAGDAQAWLTRGVVRGFELDYPGALADFNQTIKLAPRLAQGWHNRAVTLLRLDRLEEAEADFARVRELGGSIKPEAEQLRREVSDRIRRKTL